jgi:hypothetical protein
MCHHKHRLMSRGDRVVVVVRFVFLHEKLISPPAGVKLRLIVSKEVVAAEQGSMAWE